MPPAPDPLLDQIVAALAEADPTYEPPDDTDRRAISESVAVAVAAGLTGPQARQLARLWPPRPRD